MRGRGQEEKRGGGAEGKKEEEVRMDALAEETH